ncbi:response regulator transcription factor [Christensenellaceae bacterium NSJ-44]|uniref:Stage 0 sporulation protein A homolog n=1 Tax=Luoshenia tenuis TaxID=2763654 RepID=A0A926HN20_9FIRM|nr:response regulator transcription factor [Clostridium sp. BSD2780061688st1 E8]MBC8530134.1 response regulator transcription factor [Luoshenia tenuis]SCJ74129.1 Transcriptional regulatory protein walR [uncultured Clostridium sp.]
MPQTILIVDDEPMIVKGLKFSLEQDGYATDVAYDGEEALDKFKNGKFDLIILDLMLPKIDGMQVCQTIRESSEIPIVMLTAKGEDMDKILGLEYGADDYMTKPFNILELKARIKTILRRAKSHVQPVQTITVRQLVVNLDQRSVQVDGKDVRLTVKEFELLKLLATNPGKIFSRDTLLETIWKYDYLGDLRTVDVHVRRLREKIERDPGQPEFILTKWGVGYYFTDA